MIPLREWRVEIVISRKLRLPPRIKVLEAAGSIADGRVRVIEDKGSSVKAIVESSMGDRSYEVTIRIVKPGVFIARSNDNGTMLRGYIGYPILSIMMIKGILPRDLEVEGALKGIPWRVLNERFKSYDKVVEEIFRDIEVRLGKSFVDRVKMYMDNTMKTLSGYTVYLEG